VLIVIMLSAFVLKPHDAEVRYAERHYAEYRLTRQNGTFSLSGIMPSVRVPLNSGKRKCRSKKVV